jgi:hypothetical protein
MLPRRPRRKTYTTRRGRSLSRRPCNRPRVGVSHPPAGKRVGRRGRVGPRGVSSHRQRNKTTCQLGPNAGKGADP